MQFMVDLTSKQQAEIESLKMQLSLMQSKGEAVAPNVIWQQSN